MSPMNDDLDEKLKALERVAPDDLTAERVRRAAQAALAAERRAAQPLARAWSRWVAPSLVTAVAAGYLLFWTQFTAGLYASQEVQGEVTNFVRPGPSGIADPADFGDLAGGAAVAQAPAHGDVDGAAGRDRARAAGG